MGANNKISDNERNCITIGEMAPDFTALSTQGVITLSQYRGKWVMLFSEPGNFIATSTSAIVGASMFYNEYAKRNAQVLCVTIDNIFSNNQWVKEIYDTFGIIVPFPLLEDREAEIASAYGMVNPDRIFEESVRDLFIISPIGEIRAILTYPISCGRNSFEILRILDSLQLTDAYNVYTPANWTPGKPVIIPAPKTANEIMSTNENKSNLDNNCVLWYLCYEDYYSLVNDE